MLNSVFRYRRTTVSLTLLVTFFVVLLVPFELALAPFKHSQAKNSLLDKGWSHLQTLSSTKHPFSSPNNDRVYHYLRDAIDEMVHPNASVSSVFPWIQTFTDIESNHSIFINQHDVFDPANNANRLIYYESSNIIVRLQGKDLSLDGLLVSAHYDSVPTSYGTIDDGIGIVSMLGAISHLLAQGKQPERTLVFNFNNNEEFGLLGAEAFVKSKWFDEVGYFLNLEGTGSGQKTRPVLFRGTDKNVLDWYNHVTYPLASSTFMQGFKNGMVRSQTDYHVYEREGLRGIDIAFFEPRSWYHTLRDGITWTSKGSLWMMLKNTIDIVDVVAFSKKVDDEIDQEQSIFFDILGKYYLNISTGDVFKANLLLVLLFPIINAVLLSHINKNKKSWFVGLRGWTRLPLTIITTAIILRIAVSKLHKSNPLLVSVSFFYLVIAFACLSFIIGYIIMKTAASIRPIHDQKLHLIVEINLLLWVATIYAAYSLTEAGGQSISCIGVYAPLIYVLSELSLVIGIIGLHFRKVGQFDNSKITIEHIPHSNDNGSTTIGDSYGSTNGDSSNVNNESRHDAASTQHSNVGDSHLTMSDSENAPLLAGREETSSGPQEIVIDYSTYEDFLKAEKDKALKSPQYEWPFQFLLLVPIPLYLFLREGTLIGLAVHETVQESSVFDSYVWNLCATFGGIIGATCWIWADKLRATLFISIFLALLTIIWALEIPLLWMKVSTIVSTPFSNVKTSNLDGIGNRPFASEQYPLKMRFVEEFSINSNTSRAGVWGRYPFVEQVLLETPWLENQLAKGLDSSQILNCERKNNIDMEMCYFDGERPWLLSGTKEDNSFNNYMNVEILQNTNDKDVEFSTSDRYSPFEALIQLRVKHARQCYLSFNSWDPNVPRPVKAVTIYKGDNWQKELNNTKQIEDLPTGVHRDEDGNWSYKLMSGIDELKVHKLSWSSSGIEVHDVRQDEYNIVTLKLEWLPFTYDSDLSRIEELGVELECHWSDFEDTVTIDGESYTKVSTLEELIMFGGRDTAFTNLAPGIVSGKASIVI